MRLLFNFIGIALPAVAVAWLLPEWLGVRLEFALVAAAFVLFGGALLLERDSRCQGDVRLRADIHSLRASQAAVRDELAGARREMLALQEALQAAASLRVGKGSNKALTEVMDEVAVLKSLVSRLSEGQAQSQAATALQPLMAVAGGGVVGGSDERPLVLRPPAAVGLDDQSVLDEVRKSLRKDSLDLMLQPIVSLPQRKRRYYECFTRIRTDDGAVISPERYIELAEESGLITAIDNMLLFRCVQLVRKIQRENMEIGFFCNISPHTLEDEDFFGDFVEFLEGKAELAKNLVFEFAHDDFLEQQRPTVLQLERLLELGCRLSVDQVESLSVDPDRLFKREIRFVKLEAAELLSETGRDTFRTLKQELDRRAIDVIVEKIEDEQELIELLDQGIDFGQGYLFGEPRLARPAD